MSKSISNKRNDVTTGNESKKSDVDKVKPWLFYQLEQLPNKMQDLLSNRSRRKGADLGAGGGGKDSAQKGPGPGNNGGGNGICPVPESVTAASSTACTSGGGNNKKTGVVSFSQASSAKTARKAIQSVDTCVADAYDEQMIDKICSLPRNMNRNEWLAAHVLALFEHVSGISSVLSEICTPATCSVMNYPGNQKVPWLDDRGKRHNYAAMRYIDSVMAFCEAARTNQTIFPTKYGVPFSADFEQNCARIVRLLWHCMGHMYAKHWEHLGSLNLRPQFGIVLAHLTKLAQTYGLMTPKELAPLASTLQLARPSVQVQQPQQQQQTQPQRPSKRGLDEANLGGGGGGNVSSTVQGRIQRKQQQQQNNNSIRSPETQLSSYFMKSGSWGGQTATDMLSKVAAAALEEAAAGNGDAPLAQQANCQKYAQTC